MWFGERGGGDQARHQDRAHDGGALVTTVQTLSDATTVETLRVMGAATARAGVALRPAQRYEMSLAGRLGAELRHKVVQGQPFLKLNPIHRHMQTPAWMRLVAMLSMHTGYPMLVPEASN